MTVEVTPIVLLDVQKQQPVVAELRHGIEEAQLADWEGEWLPELFKALQRLKRAGVERTQWPQSRHWDWRRKTKAVEGFLGAPAFCITCDGLTQGMMIVDLDRHQARIDGQAGKPLVYVDFVENAPWNRPELNNPPRFRGVGSVLIRAAIALSHHYEYKGRIGLHSLPQAHNFYANTCGMTDLGQDEHYDRLRYFEMTSEQADAFITKGGKS